MATTVDDQGRLYLPKDTRERYGGRYRIVETAKGIRLIPVPEDPIEGLRDAMSGLQDASIDEIRDQAGEAAKDDALR